MELPPSYEAAVKQPNAFGGRIGVINQILMPILRIGVINQIRMCFLPMTVNYLLRLVVVTLSPSRTWSGKPPSTLLGKMLVKMLVRVVVKKATVHHHL